MELEPSTDAELVAETLAGNREAFGHLYDRYARLVRAIVWQAAADRSAVDDAAQECFLRAFRKLAELRDAGRFGPWIAGIARQVARERRRSLWRDRHEFRADAPEVASAVNGQSVVDDADSWRFVLEQLERLDEREQMAVRVFFLEGQTANRCAELLEMSRSGLSATLGRALARLAALVGRHESKQENER
jgi:RNA polymerase sigma-70 factor, ECF subfamily